MECSLYFGRFFSLKTGKRGEERNEERNGSINRYIGKLSLSLSLLHVASPRVFGVGGMSAGLALFLRLKARLQRGSGFDRFRTPPLVFAFGCRCRFRETFDLDEQDNPSNPRAPPQRAKLLLLRDPPPS